MNLARVWVGGGVLAVAVVLVCGWLLGIQPMLAAAKENEVQRASVAALVATQKEQLADLQRQAEDREELDAGVRDLRLALPEDAAMPALVGELSDLADEAGVSIVAFGSSDAVALADGTSEGDDGTRTRSATTTGYGTAAIPIQLTARGSLDALLGFLARVQGADRLLLPSGLTLALQEDGNVFQGGLSGYAYASPQP